MNFYLCDPKRNTECPKDMCQFECTMTTNKDCAKVLIDPDDKKEFVIYADTTDGMIERLGMQEIYWKYRRKMGYEKEAEKHN